MVFSSVTFLCIFFPIVFLLHTIVVNTRLRNALLVIASILFYAYGEPVYVILMMLSVLLNYIFGLGVAAKRKKADAEGIDDYADADAIGDEFVEEEGNGRRKAFLVIAIVVNIGLLIVFKYAGFLVTAVNGVLPKEWHFPVPKLSLPIGISFYTFQALSYVIDVYRKETDVQKSFFRLLLYVSFFPQLIAGPIVKYHDIANEISERKVTVDGVWNGLIRFSIGLGKKVLIANTMAYVADTIFSLNEAQVGFLASWLGAVAYLMQIYFDFSGYSDMAIGLGEMFGFHFQENFTYPYISGSIREFWRRWHISLSTWFRDYLYIPLGGNRKGRGRTILNKFVVFFCTGFWHGANWTFIVWGMFHGCLQMLEEIHIIPVHKKWKVFNHVYTLLSVTIGFVIFRADTLKQAGYMIASMFGFGANRTIGYTKSVAMLSPYTVFIFACALIGCTPLMKNLFTKMRSKKAGEVIAQYLLMLFSLAFLFLSLMALASQSYNPFIYFRF